MVAYSVEPLYNNIILLCIGYIVESKNQWQMITFAMPVRVRCIYYNVVIVLFPKIGPLFTSVLAGLWANVNYINISFFFIII